MNKEQIEILALIPARSGSKSVPGKNIRMVAGKRLMAYSIECAMASRLISRTIVSTDSPAYAEIARKYGAEVPFLRPPAISQDLSTDLEAFTHALKWLSENEGYVPEICVHLRPTYPIRQVKDVNRAIQILLSKPDIDSVRSVVPATSTPMKMWFMGADGLLSPVVKTDIKEPYNLPGQLLPKIYLQNGCIDVVRTKVITEMKSMSGEKLLGYVMDEDFDIDTEAQLEKVAKQLAQGAGKKLHDRKRNVISDKRRSFCFDIDGVIATLTPGNQYDLAQPKPDNIFIINSLYERGHNILLYTARGSTTGIDWSEVTRQQMTSWGVKYHQLTFGKPPADYYIDDKLLSIDAIRGITEQD